MKLIFATNNQHKIEEIQPLINGNFELITLEQAGIHTEIPEPFETLEENAAHKAKTVYNITGLNCFSEDTGLEVTALNGEPGVLSARYAGKERSPEKNIEKLLINLLSYQDKTARFRTIISLIMNGREIQFEGICDGTIIANKNGAKGFGYDPVFVPKGTNKTFAQMELAEKNLYSHRQKAVNKLVTYLQNLKDIN